MDNSDFSLNQTRQVEEDGMSAPLRLLTSTYTQISLLKEINEALQELNFHQYHNQQWARFGILIFQMWHSQRTLTSVNVVNLLCWKHRWRHRLQKSWKKRHELDWRNITRLLCVEDIATMPTELCQSGIQRNTWALSMIKWTKQRLESQYYMSNQNLLEEQTWVCRFQVC